MVLKVAEPHGEEGVEVALQLRVVATGLGVDLLVDGRDRVAPSARCRLCSQSGGSPPSRGEEGNGSIDTAAQWPYTRTMMVLNPAPRSLNGFKPGSEPGLVPPQSGVRLRRIPLSATGASRQRNRSERGDPGCYTDAATAAGGSIRKICDPGLD